MTMRADTINTTMAMATEKRHSIQRLATKECKGTAQLLKAQWHKVFVAFDVPVLFFSTLPSSSYSVRIEQGSLNYLMSCNFLF